MLLQTIDSEHGTVLVDLVDNWHPRWREVLDAIEYVGQRNALSIDRDGWLSARQSLLVAFVDDAIAGHLCFGVQPDRASNVRARLESMEVQPGFDRDEIQCSLLVAAQKRSKVISCVEWTN